MKRLSAGYAPGAQEVTVPAYRPESFGAGIVHLGAGAFFRAHLAAYTDAALASAGGDWRIVAASLRSSATPEALAAQDGRYTLVVRPDSEGHAPAYRIIGSIGAAVGPSDALQALRARLASPATRIVSTTVTEQGYGLDRARGGIDARHPDIAHDLAQPGAPRGVIGLLTQALDSRRQRGQAPFTVLCCDNLPDNGPLLRRAMLDFAAEGEPALARWIADHVAFPATMVDRITPAPAPALRAEVTARLGVQDAACVETEAFSQWVLADSFPTGRPAWEAGGAQFSSDVGAFEAMKLRMLNGAHSMMAYAGFLAGKRFVRDVMADPVLGALVERHMRAAAVTVPQAPGIDTEAYAARLLARFRNHNIAHETYQIAMDGSQKLPQRLFAPTVDTIAHQRPAEPFAFALAAWLAYLGGRLPDGTPYALRDSRETELRQLREGATPAETVSRLRGLPGILPDRLARDAGFGAAVVAILTDIETRGMREAARLSLCRLA